MKSLKYPFSLETHLTIHLEIWNNLFGCTSHYHHDNMRLSKSLKRIKSFAGQLCIFVLHTTHCFSFHRDIMVNLFINSMMNFYAFNRKQLSTKNPYTNSGAYLLKVAHTIPFLCHIFTQPNTLMYRFSCSVNGYLL